MIFFSLEKMKFKSKREILKTLDFGVKFERDEDSFFVNEIQEIRDLDLTLGMQELLHNLEPHSKTLETVLFYKDNISNLLLKALGQISPQSDEEARLVPNAIKLVKALCKDLNEEVYSFVLDSFPLMAKAIPKIEVELVQQWFECIVSIFKLYSKKLIIDYEIMLNSFKPLFTNEYQTHICKSMAVLTRKLSTFDVILNIGLKAEQIALVIAEAFKVSNQFHSSSEKWISQLLLGDCDLQVCKTVFILLGHYGTSDSMKELFGFCMKLYVENQNSRTRSF